MIENLEEIESSLKLEKGSILKAIESEEKVSIDISGLKINSTADHDKLIENIKETTAGITRELQLKEMKETHGLEYEGRKDPENFVKALTAKITKESGVEPEKKFTELKNSFDVLQGNLKNSQSKYDDLVKETEAGKATNSINAKIISAIPQNLSISNEDALLLFNSKYSTVLSDDGNLVLSQGGSILKDEIQNNKNIKDVMNDFVTPYLKKPDGGAGGDDLKLKNKPTSMDSFIKLMETQNVRQGSADFQKRMSAAISDKTLVI